jgi:hypothetical protein
MRRLVRRGVTHAKSVWLRAAVVLLAPLGLLVVPAAAGASIDYTAGPTVTVPASVTVVGTRDATVPVAIHDGDHVFSYCGWLTCDADVYAAVYSPSGNMVGIGTAANSVDETNLPQDLVVPVELSPSLYQLPSGTYSVTVGVNVTRWFDYDDSTQASTTATFSLQHVAAAVQPVAAAKLSLKRTVSKFRRHGWKIVGVLKKNGRLWSGAKVAIQVKVAGRGWQKMLTKTTGKRGRVSFTSTPDPGMVRRRARLLATGPYGQTVVSKTFALYRR